MVVQDRHLQLRPCRTIILIKEGTSKKARAVGVVLKGAKVSVVVKVVTIPLLGHLRNNTQCFKTSDVPMCHAPSLCTHRGMCQGLEVHIISLLLGLLWGTILVELLCGIRRTRLEPDCPHTCKTALSEA
jgi:hypothetical protein